MDDYVHDVNHIRHDLEGQINKPTEQMTLEEQNFYYFKLHDTNNDNRLDGLEVIAAFDHAHQEENNHNVSINEQNKSHIERPPDEEITNFIDDILKEEDLDRDGFISYEEFKLALEPETNDLIHYNLTNNFLLHTRFDFFYSELVESGSESLKLSNNNNLFLYNSAQRTNIANSKPDWSLEYNLGWIILNSENPTEILAKSNQPLFSPELD